MRSRQPDTVKEREAGTTPTGVAGRKVALWGTVSHLLHLKLAPPLIRGSIIRKVHCHAPTLVGKRNTIMPRRFPLLLPIPNRNCIMREK